MNTEVFKNFHLVRLKDALYNPTTPVISLLKLLDSGEISEFLRKRPRSFGPTVEPQNRLTPVQVANLISDYKKGEGSVYNLASKYGIHHQTISRYLKDNGCVLGRTSLSQEEIEKARELAAAGWSANRIGVVMKRDPKTIRREL